MSSDDTAAEIRAVIPSLSGSLTQLAELSTSLEASGARPLVVPTGRNVERQLDGSSVPFLPIRCNPGFGATITHGAGGEWDWLLIVNDDVTIESVALRRVLTGLRDRGRAWPALVFLDPGAPKPVPTAADALLGLSLLEPLLARLRLRGTRQLDARSVAYRPFSFVAISRSLWDAIGGLDLDFIYTFEDADFARRAHLAGAELLFPDDTGISHRKYGTSSRRMNKVLPCAAVSTSVYLQKLGVPPLLSRIGCVAALLVRVPLVLVAGIPYKAHWTGTLMSMQALVLGRRPKLPDYATS